MRGAGGSGEALALDGEVVPTIVRTVEQQQAGLLVVGTHGRTGLSRVLLGSVAEQLLQLADCSVLVVRQQNG
jgi:nucleotide-binding universal stress UspA family protein